MMIHPLSLDDEGYFTVSLSDLPYGAFTGTNLVLYTENNAPTSVIGVTDALQLCAKDGVSTGLSDDLLSATITVTDDSGTQNPADTLTVTTSGSITLDGASTSTNLILTGVDQEADYKTVFETLTFESSEISPTGSTSNRTISLTITDTIGTSVAFSKLITVTGVNDPPTLTGDYSIGLNEGASYTLDSADVFYTDVDDDNTGVTFTVSSLDNVSFEVNGSANTVLHSHSIGCRPSRSHSRRI